ncbi:MAG: MGMT family protein [Fimbriimonadaceae bacterium]|nr:MGMT family protein [Fimbriimonadaceae bacterium]
MSTREPEHVLALEVVVRAIPSGRVLSYGGVADRLPFPAHARQVGVWMSFIEEGAPWWRVVSHDGSFPIHKRDPRLAKTQEELLRCEGVEFTPSGKVAQSCFALD